MSCSAYQRFFVGSTVFEPWRVWKSWAPLKCKMFLWLASHNRCWTLDVPPRMSGLQHPPKCLLCYQDEETIQHLLTSCVFARKVWSSALDRVGL